LIGSVIVALPLTSGACKGVPGGPREQFLNFFRVDEVDPQDYQAGIPQALRLMTPGQTNATQCVVDRAVKAGAETIAPNGKAFTEDAIGMTLATRNLMSDLRSAGAITTGPKPFAAADRSRFLSALDAALMRLTRAGYGQV